MGEVFIEKWPSPSVQVASGLPAEYIAGLITGFTLRPVNRNGYDAENWPVEYAGYEDGHALAQLVLTAPLGQ